jgi:hypothetical protein
MTAQAAAQQYVQPPQAQPAPGGQGLVAGAGQPPGTWADILGLQAVAEGRISQHDLAQAGLQKAAGGATTLGEALALSLAAYANSRGRDKAGKSLAEAMAKEKGLDRYYEELDRLEEQKRADAQAAAERQREAARRAEERLNALKDERRGWDREDAVSQRERQQALEDARRERGYDVADRDFDAEREDERETQAAAPRVRPPTANQAREAKKTEININEGLRLLGQFREQLDNSPSWRDTGPIDGRVPGKYTQNLEALTKQFFPIAKSLMRSGGEGPFTDKDAEDLMRALMSPTKYSDVNREIIDNWERRLKAYRDGLSEVAGQPTSPELPPEVLERLSPEALQYINQGQ